MLRDLEKRRAYAAAYRAANREKLRAAAAAYRATNPEELRARKAAHYAAHKEEISTQRAAHYAANREKIRAQQIAYNAANPEKVRARKAAYRAANPEKMRARCATHRALLAGATIGNLAEIAHIYDRAAKDPRVRCYLCGKLIPLGSRHVDHILPLSKGGKHRSSNLAAACDTCNLGKSAKLPEAIGLLL